MPGLRRVFALWMAATLVALAAAACSDGAARPRQASAVQVHPEAGVAWSRRAVASALRTAIDRHDPRLGVLTGAEWTALDELYEPDGYAPLWLGAAGRPTATAHDALRLIGRAADDGLDPADYDGPLLGRLAAGLDTASAAGVDERARFDAALSSRVLRYLHDLHLGRVDPRTIGLRLDVPADRTDIPTILRTAVAAHRVEQAVAELRPRLEPYRALLPVLARYRALAADPTLPVLPPVAKAVHPGDPYAPVAALERLLVAFGDLPAAAAAAPAPDVYGGAIVAGVKRFQIRHGLEPDGVLGRNTVAALRVPVAWRVRQIELSLERLRWVHHLDGSRVIAINIPMFRLWAWDHSSLDAPPALAMDVIVGRAVKTRTPVFLESLREVIFRPYWNVPRSILRAELLPKIERDPGYLARENMEVVPASGTGTVPSSGAARLAGLRNYTLRVRQRPGPTNALGLVKFVFPNQEDVYMHGTPATSLFAKSRRDFSHGCVRVQDPVALAEWVLKDRPEWTRARVLAAMNGTETMHVSLPHPIPVLLFYTTAAVMPEDGAIHFAADIYGHDAPLDRALAGRSPEP